MMGRRLVPKRQQAAACHSRYRARLVRVSRTWPWQTRGVYRGFSCIGHRTRTLTTRCRCYVERRLQATVYRAVRDGRHIRPSRRYQPTRSRYNPFLVAENVGVENGLSDPLFQRRFLKRHGKNIEDDLATAAAEWATISTPGLSHEWNDLQFLKDHWDGPIVLKGIQTVADARKAVVHGMQGIVVSNHGGRQQDGVPGTLDTLEEIVAAAGSDIVKALALGANCVFMGRSYIYGLAIGGQQGVEHILKALLGEFEMTLHQAGIASVRAQHLHPGVLRRMRYEVSDWH